MPKSKKIHKRDENGNPVCGKLGRKKALWYNLTPDGTQVTCDLCIRAMQKAEQKQGKI